MAEPSLFEQMCGIREKLVPAVIRLARFATNPSTGQPVPVPIEDSEALKFFVRTLSPDELAAADAILLRAKPPQQFIKKPNTGGQGFFDEPAGYDYEHPDYIAAREKLKPLRHAMVCVAGCPALFESTPGDSLEEKAKEVAARLPVTLTDQLTAAIEDLATIAAVGVEDVEAFFRDGFGQSQKQPATPARNRRGARSKRSNASTPPTSNTGGESAPESGA